MLKCFITLKELPKQIPIVLRIYNPTSLPNRVHTQLSPTNINCLRIDLTRHVGTNSRSTRGVIPHNKFLNRHTSFLGKKSEYTPRNTISLVPLVEVCLDHNPVVEFWRVLGLMLVRVVWVDSVGHICGDDKRLLDGDIEHLLCFDVISTHKLKDSLADSQGEFRVRPLMRNTTDFLMVKGCN